MATFITAADLASYLRDSSLAPDPSLIQIVGLTNGLLTEAWDDEVDPIPARLVSLALTVAARAWVNDPSESHVSSRSVAVDDGSTTDRFWSRSKPGVYLTADEAALLNGEQRMRSIRLVNYGEV